jgi:AcrR family transcriptional regulator
VSDKVNSSFQDYIVAMAGKWEDASSQRKQERSKRRQREIMRAAMRIFARDGVSRARIGDIASEAGMSVSSIYDYFPSKEILAYAVPMDQLARFYSEYASAAATEKTYRGRIRLYLWMSGDYARRNPEWARILYLEIWPSVLVDQTEARHSLDDYTRILVHMIREGEKAGEWEPGAYYYDTASILVGSVNQVIITWLIYRRPKNLMKNLASVIDRVMALLTASPVATSKPTATAPHQVAAHNRPLAAKPARARIKAGGEEVGSAV